MNAMSKLHDMLIKHEGMRLKPYRDTVGKMTIGVGRNLDDVGITAAEAMDMLDADIAQAMADIKRNLPYFDSLSDARKAALIDMCFNLGWPRLSGFKKTLAAIERKEWDTAANEMLRSVWAQQVGNRAVELSKMIRTGEW